ncbi:MAG: hypothetical protein ACI4QE_01765 [Acutalibacteraceae bacterium]
MKKWLSEQFSKNCVRRALRTFLQTALAYIVTNVTCTLSGITDISQAKTIIIGVIISAIAAGISAVMNLKEC